MSRSRSRSRSRSQPRSRCRWGDRESRVKEIKYPESSFLPECRSLSPETSKEQKMPNLTSHHKCPNNKTSSGSLFGCLPFESTWRNSLLTTQRIKKEYTSAFGLRESEENMAIPNLTQGIQKYQANRSPVLQMKKGFGFDPPKPFPVGFYDKKEPNYVPATCLLPSTSSQILGDEFCKSRREVHVVDLQKRGLDSWNPGSLKMPDIHGGGGEMGAWRSRKNNKLSRTYLGSSGHEYKFAHHHFTDPVTGAAPEYLQRLSQMASLECETINEEKNKKMKRGKKQETWTS
ncbi:putative uncharacterized protein C8orf89 homolog isoform X2 [Alligator sinensis]|uniref:Uncharacterized protein n=1 Tax=Alligator sinensis TaxID=38654 RepID=A0A1U8CYT5_ALLSI|nr:putative uncharacterized protein C8orf89 homolog isoform X2 [Alligator sinensis]